MKRFYWALIVVILAAIGVAVGNHWATLKFSVGADIGGKLGTFAFLSLLIERTVEVIMTIWRGHAADQIDLELAKLQSAAGADDLNTKTEAFARITLDGKAGVLTQIEEAQTAESEARRAETIADSAVSRAKANPEREDITVAAREAVETAATARATAKQTWTAAQAALTEILGQALKSKQDAAVQFKSDTRAMALPLGVGLGCLIAATGAHVLQTFIESGSIPANSAQATVLDITDIVFTGMLLAGGSDPIHKMMDLYRKFIEASSNKTAGASAK